MHGGTRRRNGAITAANVAAGVPRGGGFGHDRGGSRRRSRGGLCGLLTGGALHLGSRGVLAGGALRPVLRGLLFLAPPLLVGLCRGLAPLLLRNPARLPFLTSNCFLVGGRVNLRRRQCGLSRPLLREPVEVAVRDAAILLDLVTRWRGGAEVETQTNHNVGRGGARAGPRARVGLRGELYALWFGAAALGEAGAEAVVGGAGGEGEEEEEEEEEGEEERARAHGGRVHVLAREGGR